MLITKPLTEQEQQKEEKLIDIIIWIFNQNCKFLVKMNFK